MIRLSLFFLLHVNAWGKPWVDAIARNVTASLGHGARVTVGHVDVRGGPPSTAEVTLISKRPLGLVSLQWRWMKGDSSVVTVGTAEIRAFAPVAIATRPLTPGEPLKDAIRFEERELGPLYGSGYFTDAAQVTPLRVRVPLVKGAVVLGSLLETPVLVQPGQLVDLVREKGSMKVTVRAEAMQRGKLEDWVRVRNPATQKIVFAKVAGSGLVVLP